MRLRGPRVRPKVAAAAGRRRPSGGGRGAHPRERVSVAQRRAELSETPHGDELRQEPRRTRAWRNLWWFLLIAIFLALFVYLGLKTRG